MHDVRVFFSSNDVFTCVTWLIPGRPNHHPICSVAGISIVKIMYYPMIENFYGIPIYEHFRTPTMHLPYNWIYSCTRAAFLGEQIAIWYVWDMHFYYKVCIVLWVCILMSMYTQNSNALLCVCRVWEWMHTRNAETLIIITLHNIIILRYIILCTLIF